MKIRLEQPTFMDNNYMDKFIGAVHKIAQNTHEEDQEKYMLMEAVAWTSINVFCDVLKKNFSDDALLKELDHNNNKIIEQTKKEFFEE